jgi:GNAT superfamily N-acetyltransferase
MTHPPSPVGHDEVVVVAADHPSLTDEVDRFVMDVRAETRFFGPTAAAAPKPSRTLLARLGEQGSGMRVAATLGGRVIGLARVDDLGELWVAVAAEHRGRGVGTAIAAALIDRCRTLGYTRLVMRSSRRSRAALALGGSMGFTLVELGRGRVDLILDLAEQRGAPSSA